VVDGLETVSLPALGPDLEPWDVDVRQRPQELEPLLAVGETKLARQIRSTNADRRGIEIQCEEIRRRLRCLDELIGAEESMILLAVKQRSKPTFDRNEPVREGADRDPVRSAAELSARMEGRVGRLRLVVGALLSAEAEADRVEA
jgi:hypothetical protein